MSESVYGIYTDPVTGSQLNAPPRPGGSFGPVFIVLAVIVVVSGVACVLGRLCSKQRKRVKTADVEAEAASRAPKKTALGPKEWQKPNFIMRDGDIEFGFDKKTPPVKNGGKAKAKAHPKASQPHVYNNGGHKPAVRFAENV